MQDFKGDWVSRARNAVGMHRRREQPQPESLILIERDDLATSLAAQVWFSSRASGWRNGVR
jgi:hypothetical protein